MNQKSIPTVIGVDIGTNTTKIAAVLRGAVDIITNQANFRETPSIVGYGQGERKIGEMGSAKLKSNFKNTIISPTRYVGLKGQQSAIRNQLINSPCNWSLSGQNILFKVNVNQKSENLTPQQVLASFMTHIQFIIQHNNLDPKLIVFSVPSFYTQIQKRAIINAAEISGLKNIKLVTQAVALGLDYGIFKKSQMGQGKKVAFVDFGYSNLTVSLINFTSTKMQVVLQLHNRNAGCRSFDQKIFDYIAKKFEQKKGLNLRQSKKACLKLLQAIQKQRKILSGISETQVQIQCLFEDEDLSQQFTRQILLRQAAQVFDQTTILLKNFKEEIQKMGVKLDSIELVGGGSRIPRFIQIVEQVFGMSTSRTTNSSQTIARGAALSAVQKSGLFRFDTFQVQNKSSHSISLSWRNSLQNSSAQNNVKIIQFNENIPLQKEIRIPTENSAQIIIYYDNVDSQVEHRIAKIVCQAPKSEKKQLILNFQINENEFVELKSIKQESGSDLKYEISFYRQLTSEQILSFKAKERQMYVKDFSIIRLYQKKNELQSFIYRQRQAINNQQFKKYLTQEQIQVAQNYLKQISQALQDQGQKMGIKDYQEKMTQIQIQIKKLNEKAKKKKIQVLQHYKQIQKLKIYALDVMKQISQTFRNSKPVAQAYQSIKQIAEWADDALKVSKQKKVFQLPVIKQQDLKQQYENIKILYSNLVNPQRTAPKQQPPKQQPKQQPRQQPRQQERQPKFEQRYDPNQFMRGSWFGPQRFYEDPQQEMERQRQARYRQQQQQQRQRQRQQQQQEERQRQAYYQRKRQEDEERQRQAQYLQRQRQHQQQQRRRQQQQHRQHDPFGMSRSGYFPSNNFFGGFF